MVDINVTSTVTIDMPKLGEISAAAVQALEMTAALLLSEVKNAQVFPFNDVPDGAIEKGKRVITPAGNLQNDNTFVDPSHSAQGVVDIISDTPYARRLYYHPEYNFSKKYNANARGEWYEDWLPGGQQEDFAAEVFAKLYREESGL